MSRHGSQMTQTVYLISLLNILQQQPCTMFYQWEIEVCPMRQLIPVLSTVYLTKTVTSTRGNGMEIGHDAMGNSFPFSLQEITHSCTGNAVICHYDVITIRVMYANTITGYKVASYILYHIYHIFRLNFWQFSWKSFLILWLTRHRRSWSILKLILLMTSVWMNLYTASIDTFPSPAFNDIEYTRK